MTIGPKKQADLFGGAGPAGIGGSMKGSLLAVGGGGIGGSNSRDLLAPPEPEPGPLDDLQGATPEERGLEQAELARAILVNREQRAGQQAAIELANDTEYWVAVYFQTREQKEAWLKAIGYGGQDDPDKYLDGVELAAKHGITLPPRPAPYKVGKLDKRLVDMT